MSSDNIITRPDIEEMGLVQRKDFVLSCYSTKELTLEEWRAVAARAAHILDGDEGELIDEKTGIRHFYLEERVYGFCMEEGCREFITEHGKDTCPRHS